MANQGIAVVAGIGAGTGFSVAKRFALQYPVALLARSKENLDPVVDHINKAGGKADVGNEQSMKDAFAGIQKAFPDQNIAAAVFNVGGTFKRSSFLDVSTADFLAVQSANTTGAFLFAQHVLRNQMAHISQKGEHPSTLIFTGATASIKGGPTSSSFGVGKFGVRALSQSLAREFGPKGIHVAHAIIDGIIDIPRTKSFKVSDMDDDKLSADSIAEAYWQLHAQDRTAWTQEIDLRPYCEKF